MKGLYPITGVRFRHGAADALAQLKLGAPLALRREPKNQYDRNAIAVWSGETMLGYIPKGLARLLSERMDKITMSEIAGKLAGIAPYTVEIDETLLEKPHGGNANETPNAG